MTGTQSTETANENEITLAFHPKQELLLDSDATEILYGGSLGSGKSWVLRALAILYSIEIPGLQTFFFRREYSQLENSHWRGPKSFPIMVAPLVRKRLARVTATSIEFWNGSQISGNHCQLETDVNKFLGAEFHCLIIDELTTFSAYQYQMLRSRCRLGALKLPDKYRGKFPLILCSAAPGGIGHHWVREQFVDMCPDMVPKLMPPEQGGLVRQFIPARLIDNPTMDKDYENRIKGISDSAIVAAGLRGDWSVVSGSYFGDVWNTDLHVVRSFPIPLQNWKMWRGMDDGKAKPACVLWIAEDQIEGRFYVTSEIYQAGLGPDELSKMILKRDSSLLRSDTAGRVGENADRLSGYLDDAAFADPGNNAPARGDQMNRAGCNWKKSEKYPGCRVHRWQYIHSLLEPDGDGVPRLRIFSTCTNLIKALPAAPRDQKDPEDIDTEYPMDHALDALSYGLASRRGGFATVKMTGI